MVSWNNIELLINIWIFRRQTYVGRIKFAQFDTEFNARRIIVATEENVLAALNLKTGEYYLVLLCILVYLTIRNKE